MSSQMVMSAMNGIEFAMWALLGLVFWRKGLHRRFSAMGLYLGLRVVTSPLISALVYLQQQPGGSGKYFLTYFYIYWAIYLASAVILLFVCIEIFRAALSAYPGLMKFGIVIFRWVILASVIVTFSSISLTHGQKLVIPDVAMALMRSVSILELCLLGFLCLSMNALKLSIRDVAFGIALGFGMLSANDFIVISLISRYASLNAPLQFVYESVILCSLGVWVTYCALPEPARKPMVVAANSTIYRWNEIASALGHPTTQVAAPQAANSFFLTDVEKVVEKVLSRNLKGRESEL